MVPRSIEQCAKEKNLGTFKRRYAESLSLVIVLIMNIIFIGSAIVCFLNWLLPINGDRLSFWFPLLLDPLLIFFTVLIWGLYLDMRQRWLYVYSDGFVYDQQGHIQGHHIHEIISVDLRQLIDTAHGGSTSDYVINLDNGEHISIKNGSEIKSRVELDHQSFRHE